MKRKVIVKCSFCNGTGKRILETGLENLGNRIATLRLSAGLSQAQLGIKMGYSRTSITNLEAGRQDLPVHKIYELATIFKIEPGELI